MLGVMKILLIFSGLDEDCITDHYFV